MSAAGPAVAHDALAEDPGSAAAPDVVEPAASAGRAADAGLHRKLVWLTLFRLATITVLLGGTAAVNWRFGPPATAVVAPLYAVIALTYGASLGFAAFLAARRGERVIAFLQVVLDVAIAAAVVATTGFAESVFVFMFLLAIVNGSILLYGPGAVFALALALVAYAAVAIGLAPTPEALRVTVFAHASAFVATAALAGYLAEQLRRTGERLAESESDLATVTALHESIVQSVTSGLLTLDRRGRITFLNREAERMTGLTLARVSGDPVERWFPSFERAARGETPYRNARGERRLLGYSAFPLRGRDGADAGSAVIFQDLTELRALEETLDRSRRLADLGQVAAGLAHELRNPLASISGCVELLRAAQGLAPGDQRVLEIVLRETARLDGLLARFLEFSRPAPPAPRPTDLAAVAGETLDVFAADPAAAGLRVERALSPTPVVCDPDQLRQVLWNLLSNAAHALGESGRGGTLRVACAPGDGGAALLSVEDDGPGIPPDVAAKLFTPFFTTRAHGTGLGLAVVQRIVDAHGGAVHVASSPGAGARFSVRLPGAASGRAGDPR